MKERFAGLEYKSIRVPRVQKKHDFNCFSIKRGTIEKTSLHKKGQGTILKNMPGRKAGKVIWVQKFNTKLYKKIVPNFSKKKKQKKRQQHSHPPLTPGGRGRRRWGRTRPGRRNRIRDYHEAHLPGGKKYSLKQAPIGTSGFFCIRKKRFRRKIY